MTLYPPSTPPPHADDYYPALPIARLSRSALRLSIASLLLLAALYLLYAVHTLLNLDPALRPILFLIGSLIAAICGGLAFLFANQALHLSTHPPSEPDPAITQARRARLLGIIGLSLSLASSIFQLLL